MEKTEKFDWENDAREKQKQEIASIKGRELVLRLSDQDVEEICELTGRYGTTVEELLENFVGDLIDGTYCNGSDEHEYARRWFERCDLGMFPETDFVSYMLNSYGSDRVDVLIGCQEELQEVENEISKSKEQLLEYQNKLNDSSYDWERKNYRKISSIEISFGKQFVRNGKNIGSHNRIGEKVLGHLRRTCKNCSNGI